jgi:hypothetical protein
MTTKDGMSINQNTQSIIKKVYNYPNEIWDIIKEYIGIGCYIYRVLENLNSTQLKNIINCTFRCEFPSDINCCRTLSNIFKKELWKKEYSDMLRNIIVKRTKQTIKELGKNLSSEMCVSTYAYHNITCLYLGIENNMHDKKPYYPKMKATPRRFDFDVQFVFK